MDTVLVTGGTGFVGSAIAASLLAAGHRVLAISRNDSDGERTRAAVRDAAKGFGRPLDARAEQRLAVVEAEGDSLDAALTRERLADVGAAWHAAAEMTYSSPKVLASYHTNVVLTTRLYRLLAERAPRCRRFFYISTAYTAGMDGGPVEEELHAGRSYDNVYQLTKCAAEHALAHRQRVHGLPVTLFRPTIVVGHSANGWARRNGFGFYMFVEALESMGHAGIRRVHLALNAAARPDLVPIDRLAADAVALTGAEGAKPVEVLHCTGGLGLPLDAVLRTIGRPCGIDVHFGALQTPADKLVDRAIDPNRRFANTEWAFSSRRLEELLGCAPRVAPGEDALERMVRWYVGDGDVARARRRTAAASPALSPSLAAQAV